MSALTVFFRLCAATCGTLFLLGLLYFAAQLVRYGLYHRASSFMSFLNTEALGPAVITLFGSLFAFPVVALVGLPLALFLLHYKLHAIWHWCAAASLLPSVLWIVGLLIADDRLKWSLGMLVFLCLSLGSIAIFWWFWVRGFRA